MTTTTTTTDPETDHDRETEGRSLHDRLTGWARAQLEAPPRFVSERPPSLTEHIAYARAGEWHSQPDGAARRWHLAYTYAIAVPVVAVAAWAAWAAARPGRLAPLLVLLVVLATALDAIPIVAWFVPDWASASNWPPRSWLARKE
ncbi:MAG: hypothetical protein GEU83_15105 [Pseudonocardiaceae bacterium]|nr:hypothetical protein [Pseudonocardiaceae bacterium]